MTQYITTADIHVQCVSQVVAVFNYIEYIYSEKNPTYGGLYWTCQYFIQPKNRIK